MEKVTERNEYKMFHAIKQRCYNPNNFKYKDYGGRGIIMCDRWVEEGVNGFLNFLEDMGDRPEGNYSIERIDVNANYEPSNCKWITMSEQSMNKRNTAVVMEGDVFGKLMVIKEVDGEQRPGNRKRRMFLCRCECGKEVIKRMDKLRLGYVSSCGLKPCNKFSNHTNEVRVL